jgi:hypothetical protein
VGYADEVLNVDKVTAPTCVQDSLDWFVGPDNGPTWQGLQGSWAWVSWESFVPSAGDEPEATTTTTTATTTGAEGAYGHRCGNGLELEWSWLYTTITIGRHKTI